MPRGYWIARVDVRDAEAYKDYVAAAKPAFERFGAKSGARRDNGCCRRTLPGRNVIIEFASLKQAQDCYNSPEYQHAKSIRNKVADGEVVLVEGLE
jgi:uncharacterized protein (DUF1330 family)